MGNIYEDDEKQNLDDKRSVIQDIRSVFTWYDVVIFAIILFFFFMAFRV